jgi:TPP-dependent pyruvate/acetoin dehydrogenase alpha subunit
MGAGISTDGAAARTGLLARLYEQMVFIRRFEETLLEMFAEGKLMGTTHTYIGQEADAVGLIAHLDPERDVVFSNHRCHGHYLAFTGDAFGLLSEVMGKATGTCGGKGGSQHLCKGNFYSNGVQGSIVPVSTGIALAEKEKGSGAVTTVFLGDGTLGQGAVYECLNMAALWQLPLLFVVENNEYAQTTPRGLAFAGSIAERAAAFGIGTDELSTTDVLLVHEAAGRAVARVRETGAPFFLVLNTYRFSPHSKGDDFRDPAEIEERRKLDPLAVAGAALEEVERIAIEEACERRLAETIAAAEAAPDAGEALR